MPIQPILGQVVDRIEELYDRDSPAGITGVPTGLTDLDEKTSGLQPSDMIVLAARPGMGKTSLALNIAENVAVEAGLPVAVFSMEMPGTQLATRFLSSVGRIDQHKIRTGKLTDEEWQRLTYALGKLHEAPIFIDETPGLNPTDLRARCRRLHRQCGRLGLIVIDYLQLMTSLQESDNRSAELSEISRSVKSLANELHIPIIALSQLNRSHEQRPNKRPVDPARAAREVIRNTDPARLRAKVFKVATEDAQALRARVAGLEREFAAANAYIAALPQALREVGLSGLQIEYVEWLASGGEATDEDDQDTEEQDTAEQPAMPLFDGPETADAH